KAKNRFLTGKLLELETNNGKASALGEAAVIYGNPQHVNTGLARLQAVTAPQVQAALDRYLSGKKKVLIEYLPEAMKPATSKKEEAKS
ncbi:MAG: M16 family metallopeptidase, partial [Chthoniobacterales bacterium]